MKFHFPPRMVDTGTLSVRLVFPALRGYGIWPCLCSKKWDALQHGGDEQWPVTFVTSHGLYNWHAAKWLEARQQQDRLGSTTRGRLVRQVCAMLSDITEVFFPTGNGYTDGPPHQALYLLSRGMASILPISAIWRVRIKVRCLSWLLSAEPRVLLWFSLP